MSLTTILKYAIPATIISSLPLIANAADHAGSNLKADDFVGISFWFISMALVAATAFFFLENTCPHAQLPSLTPMRLLHDGHSFLPLGMG